MDGAAADAEQVGLRRRLVFEITRPVFRCAHRPLRASGDGPHRVLETERAQRLHRVRTRATPAPISVSSGAAS